VMRGSNMKSAEAGDALVSSVLPLHRRNRHKKKVADIGLQQIKLDSGIIFEHLAIRPQGLKPDMSQCRK
jgi:hypothetical protein